MRASLTNCRRNTRDEQLRTFEASLLTIAHRLITVADYDKATRLDEVSLDMGPEGSSAQGGAFIELTVRFRVV